MAISSISFKKGQEKLRSEGDFKKGHTPWNRTARAITWGASFVSTTVTLPTTTVISTLLRVLLEWNGTAWACVATA